jgi:FlaA1/EpsC-like NDP-sugar epimerase
VTLRAIDAASWLGAVALATFIRYNFVFGEVRWAQLVVIALDAAVIQQVVGSLFGLYSGRRRAASFDEVSALGMSAAVSALVLLFVDVLVTPQPIPRSAPIGAGVIALVGMAGARYWRRILHERGLRPSGAEPVLVFGAGEGGTQVVTAMLRDPSSPYLPVALIDDDPTKKNLQVLGVPVVGDRSRFAEVASAYRATTLIIAIPSADADFVRGIRELAESEGIAVKVLPSTRDLFGGPVVVGDVRDVDESELLGRRAVETDLTSIASYLTGKRVLVTGAGGSIGSELCRQIDRFGPEELFALDRDESGLHALQLSIEGRALLDSPNLVLADIRDRERLTIVFAETKPDVVFHAAALKHLALLEKNPWEAVQSNVLATQALLELAQASGVKRFVNISTDKAADPCSVLGYSKRICERLTAHYAVETGLPYLSVRFGNVLFSRGSVLGTFRAQVANGGPITVTDPDVTRYFMTVHEAIELVVQAGAIGRSGEVLVLDMGVPVRIDDVARMLADRADRPVEVIYTGLRPGEKLNEVLLGAGEAGDRPFHPLITHVGVASLSPGALSQLVSQESSSAVIDRLARLSSSVETPAND